MWGHPEVAAELSTPPPLPAVSAAATIGDASSAPELLSAPASQIAAALLTISGPAHAALSSSHWSELFLGYEALVHLERHHAIDEGLVSGGCSAQSESVVGRSCSAMVKHCRTSSNLAALGLHTARMLRDVTATVVDAPEPTSTVEVGGMDPKRKIELVGRARATAGCLNLLRIWSHAVIADACCSAATASGGSNATASSYLLEAFTYRSRSQPSAGGSLPTPAGDVSMSGTATMGGDRDAAPEVLDAALSFLSAMGRCGSRSRSNGNGNGLSPLLTTQPELYDVAAQTLALLLVLTSTQLYSPMMSSVQCLAEYQQRPIEVGGNDAQRRAAEMPGDQYFLRRIMELVKAAAAASSSDAGTTKTKRNRNGPHLSSAQSLLATLLNLQTICPKAPAKSITGHHAELAAFVAEHARGERIGPDGMYETHAIVSSLAPKLDAKGRPIKESGPTGGGDSGAGSDGGGEAAAASSSSSSSLAVDSGSADQRQHLPASADGAGSGLTARHTAALLARYPIRLTRGVLHVSSTLLLLPFRLMNLALTLFGGAAGRQVGTQLRLLGNGGIGDSRKGAASVGSHTGEGDYDHARMVQLEAALSAAAIAGGGEQMKRKKLTNDVLWLTDSPLADLASALFLILVNNYRAGASSGISTGGIAGHQTPPPNPFRSELLSLTDKRWEGSESSRSLGGENAMSLGEDGRQVELSGFEDAGGLLSPSPTLDEQHVALSTNFEALLESFGRSLHTESSQLFLYTLLQSSPTFAASVAVSSDIDALVMPLLRTLYFSSTMTTQVKGKAATASASASSESTQADDQQPKMHFRSQSQLYVILILLLIFSQDQSFGPDAFRRRMVARVPWYKERHLRDINLGSVLLLTLLRSITFNLHRLKDPFLLSNCCAVLLNISPHISGLHTYAAMRLASVTVSCMKKYTVLVGKNGGKPADERDVMSELGMYGETCRTLLQLVKHGVRARVVKKNLHLVYSLVYLQRDFYDIMSARHSPFKTPEIGVIMSIIAQADKAVQEDGTARTAEQTMKVLEQSVDKLKAVTRPPPPPGPGGIRERSNSFDSMASDISSASDVGDFTFTYEEEEDPEIFFVPYLWEVVVCALTASTLEWDKINILAFPLLEGAVEEDDPLPPALQNYAADAGEAV